MPHKPKPPIILTDEQEKLIIETFKKTPDLNVITQTTFKNKKLDGRSKEGRAIRNFLAKLKLQHNTTKHKPIDLSLNNQQKEFLMGDTIGGDMTPLEITRICFKNRELKSFSKEHTLVLAFLNEFRPELVGENRVATDKYLPPLALSRAIVKVNRATHSEYMEDTMPVRAKKNCEKLLSYLHSPRFLSIINNYSLIDDRDLFEAEYVRAVWDKPDLTVDELNNYITVCSNYVRLRHIQKRVDNLNKLLNLEYDDTNISIKINELIKTTSSELNDCEKRIEAMTRSLNGTRAERLKHKSKENGSILALVEAFQHEEERKKMADLIEMENKLVDDEITRLENLDEYMVRVLGIDRVEIV